jgi:hypothetical protein
LPARNTYQPTVLSSLQRKIDLVARARGREKKKKKKKKKKKVGFPICVRLANILANILAGKHVRLDKQGIN